MYVLIDCAVITAGKVCVLWFTRNVDSDSRMKDLPDLTGLAGLLIMELPRSLLVTLGPPPRPPPRRATVTLRPCQRRRVALGLPGSAQLVQLQHP